MTRMRPLARTDGLLVERVGGELLVYDQKHDTASRLNKSAALVWRSCDGNRDLAELVAIVAEELGEPADEDVVLMALDTLAEHGLIASGFEEREGSDVAWSRRRFFRRAGIAGTAAVAAPVVYSLVVPASAAALSPYA